VQALQRAKAKHPDGAFYITGCEFC
jgi:hypothetical protein